MNLHSSEYIYKFLEDNNLLFKYIHFVGIKPTTVKYFFVRVDNFTIGLQNNTLTILEGFACERSDLTTKPECMSEEDYAKIPESYKGVLYNIYYEKNPFIATLCYHAENDTQLNYTSFQSERMIHIYCCVTCLEDIENLLIPDLTDVFIGVETSD